MDNLVNELIEKITRAHIKASKVKIDKKRLGNEVFIYPNTEDSVFNPKYLSVDHYYQLIEFEEFVKKHKNLEYNQVDDILNASSEFIFLRKIKENVPNFLDELRRHGAKPVAIIYLNDKIFGNGMEL